jgi:predicted nucleic acid-binding protein
MILVDASVIVDYLRTADPRLGALFHSLPLAVCGVTRAEMLHGVRNPVLDSGEKIKCRGMRSAGIERE